MLSIGGALLVLLARLYYGVSPWAAYQDAQRRHLLFGAHARRDQELLDFGYYDQAAREFSTAREMLPSRLEAVEGARKCELLSDLVNDRIDVNSLRLLVRDFLEGNDHNYLLTLGKLHQKLSEQNEATEHFLSSVRAYVPRNGSRYPAYYEGLERLAWSYYHQGKYEEMRSSFRELLELAPLDFRAHTGVSYAEYLVAYAVKKGEPFGSLADAIEQADFHSLRACELSPGNALALVNRGDCCRVSNPAEARRCHIQALRLLCDGATAHHRYNSGRWGYTTIDGVETFSFHTVEDKVAYLHALLAVDELAQRAGSAPTKAWFSHAREFLRPGASPQARRAYEDQRQILLAFGVRP